MPAGATQRIRLVYEHLLPTVGDRVDYVLPRSESLAGRRPWTIRVDVESQHPISTVYSPSHALQEERLSPGHLRVELAEEARTEPGVFRLSYLRDQGDGVSASLFAYPDEEVGGGIGPQWLLQQGISKPDYAVSAGFSYGVVTAHNGCLHLEVEVRGRLSHAALPQNGVDALEAANGVLSALYEARKSYTAQKSDVPGIDHPTLVVGLIEGGINTNVVPDRVRLRLDRRLIPEETGGEVEAELGAVIQDAVSRYPGASADIRRIMLAEPLAPVPGLDRLVEPFVRHGSAIMGETVATHGVPIYTDARHYALAGVPTILYGAGPRTVEEAGGHGADENLVLDDLRKATEVVALSLCDLISG